jgi:hypothetical protein
MARRLRRLLLVGVLAGAFAWRQRQLAINEAKFEAGAFN